METGGIGLQEYLGVLVYQSQSIAQTKSGPSTGHDVDRHSKSLTATKSLEWYNAWLTEKFAELPPLVKDGLQSFPNIFTEISKFARVGRSIDDIAAHLVNLDLIDSEGTEDKLQIAKAITFAAVGWQTMLFEPAFGTCPAQQIAIADVLDGYTGQAYMTLKQDRSRTKRPLSEFLLGFGLMLPRENLCISADQDDCVAFEKLSVVRPEEFNAALLQSLANIDIKWVDVMAPHLEFDRATNTLFLFRYPSFCAANIQSKDGAICENLLYSCAAECPESGQWASETEISQFLQEILLSYRLLFGQTKDSRRHFQTLNIFDDDVTINDPLLPSICTSKTNPLVTPDRAFYRLSRDFPILRSRIVVLENQIANLKPRGWKELWRDRRDSAHWLTFWAVIIIGGSGIFLSLVQTVLQAIQLA